jgi:hypothetical protein
MPLDELIITMFCHIDDFVKAHFPARRLRQRGPLPQLRDSEVITMELVGEYLSLNTEKAIYQYFARHWRHFFPRLPDRSNFVRQCAATGGVKRRFLDALTQAEDTFIQLIDSMPLHVCEFVRARRCRLFRGQASYGKWFGQTIYGFKLHLKLTMRGLVRAFALTPAKTSDVTVVSELVETDHHGWVVGDKGYRSKPLSQQLLQEQQLVLHTPVRRNEKTPQLAPPALHQRLVGMRRLIETVNGQLEQQFQIKDVWARDLWHLTVRIVRKLLAHALCVLLNIQLGRDPLKLKSLVA